MKRRKITACLLVLFMVISSFAIATPEARAQVSDKQSEDFANIVLFAHFSGSEAADGQAYFANKTNRDAIMKMYDGTHGRSFTNYLKSISYDKFNVHNVFPQDTGSSINSYELSITKSDAANYDMDYQIIHELLQKIPGISNKTIDYNNDGTIDNLTVILYGAAENGSQVTPSLYPHKSNYVGTADLWSGKHVHTYNILNTERLSAEKSGLIAHEFLHSIGYPDLYTNGGESEPVCMWDIMAISSPFVNYPLAYMRSHVSDWIDIDTLTSTENNLILHEQSNKNGNQAYILKSPLNDQEFFVAEYRRQPDQSDLIHDDTLDFKIGESGIIVYRINTTVTDLSNHHGQIGVYVFRPQEGDPAYDAYERTCLYRASLSSNSTYSRTSIGSSDMNAGLSDGALTFSDGSNSGIVLSNISAGGGESMTFDVSIPDATQFDLWTNTGYTDTSNENYKCADMINFDNSQYLMTYDEGTYKLSKYDGSSWTQKGAAFTSTNYPDDMKLMVHNNELYFGYISYMNSAQVFTLKKFNTATNSWSSVSNLNDCGYSFDMQSINGKLNLVFVSNSEAALYALDGTSIQRIGSYLNEGCSQPKLASLNNQLYVSVRKAAGDIIKLYKYDSISGFTQISNDSLSANNYDMLSMGDKIYVIIGGNDSNLKMSSYNGTSWSYGASSSITGMDPTMVSSQGKLYVLVSGPRDTDKTKMYRYDNADDTFTQEGLNVDGYAEHLNLTSSNDSIYVGYTLKQSNYNNIITVKSKTTTNSLQSLSITPPNKTVYLQGDSVDTAGLIVTANYISGSKVLSSSDYAITGFDTSTVGNRLAKISFGGKSNTFAYEVQEKADNNKADGWYYEGSKKVYYKDGFKLKGLQPINGKTYYFNSKGIMQTGWQQIDNKWYYFAANGAAVKGWLKYSKSWYYMNADCEMATDLQTIDGSKYYLAPGGEMKTGWQKVDNKWYYFKSSGIAAKGWVKSGSYWYYMNADCEMLTGLHSIDGYTYYLGPGGEMKTGWQKISNKWYYFNSGGAAVKGWLKSGKSWYYMGADYQMKTGWLTMSGSTYYLAPGGEMKTGWQSTGGKWYYFNSGGIALKGWVKSGNYWYYMNSDYQMVTGLQTIDGSLYYLAPGGEMKTGWQKISNKWYYFYSIGIAAKGWLRLGSVKYYMGENNQMVTGTVNIDGKNHRFADSGAWIKQL